MNNKGVSFYLVGALVLIILGIVGYTYIKTNEASIPDDVPCKDSYLRYMQVQKSIRPTALLEYRTVNSLEELQNLEKEYKDDVYDNLFSPSNRYTKINGEEFQPTYFFAIKKEATSASERNIVSQCICEGSELSCGNS